MQGRELVNVHYLLAIEQSESGVRMVRHSIPRPYDELVHLQTLRDDDASTLLDMYAFASGILSKNERMNAYSYVYPREYNDEMYGDVVCPEIRTSEEYHELLNDIT